jgi:putative endonuclease
MNTTLLGRTAEMLACEYLEQKGFVVLARNWRTPRCEIDIVARRGKTVYFIEVKARKSNYQGYGFDAVTTKKQQQMRLGARMWGHAHSWRGDYSLIAVSVDANVVSMFEIEN